MAEGTRIPRYYLDDMGTAEETDDTRLGVWMRTEEVLAVFKEDVAYMPVPRCKTCAHWRDLPDATADPVDRVVRSHADDMRLDGLCYLNTTMFLHEDQARRKAVAYAGRFFVARDFGCVQWKEKGTQE
jgi:hypothetical protein